MCIVTGSTGGIGLATAKLLADEGARVVVCGRDSERVERARGESGAALGVVCDLAEPAAPEELVAETAGALGPPDCLVNNVGAAYQLGFEELSDRHWDEMWQLNVMSYVRAIRAVLPGMKTRGGVIVNVSSTAGKRPSTGMPNYSVTKAAVLSLSGWSPTSMRRTGFAATRSLPDPPQRRPGSGRADWPTSRPSGAARHARRCSTRSARAGRSGGSRSRRRSPR